MNITLNTKEELYTFRGKTFMCDAVTIKHLNYALALNGKSDRYTLVDQSQKKKYGNDQ